MLIILERKWYIIVLVPIENNAISRFYFTQLVHPGQGPAYSPHFFYARLVQFCCRSADFMDLCTNNMQPASGFDWRDGGGVGTDAR
jgi:hypothetical protein